MNPSPSLGITTDAPGTDAREKSTREKEIRRALALSVHAALPEHERLRPGSENDAQEWTDRVLRAVSGKGWRVHKSNPVCSVCREALEREGQPWREYLNSPELQEHLTADKEKRQADAARYRAELEAGK